MVEATVNALLLSIHVIGLPSLGPLHDYVTIVLSQHWQTRLKRLLHRMFLLVNECIFTDCHLEVYIVRPISFILSRTLC